jgi:D-aspartate ligase
LTGSASVDSVTLTSPPQAILLGTAEAGLSLARELNGRGVRVAALVPPAQAWVARSRHVDGYVLQRLSKNPDPWLEVLDDLASRHGDGVIISGSDRVTEFLVAERERVPHQLRCFESPDNSHLDLMNRASLFSLADKVGVRTPWSLSLPSRDRIEEVAELASYPCIVKPVLSHVWRRLFGEHRVLLVHGPDELALLSQPALDRGVELLVGEYVPGPDTGLETALVVRRADGSHALSFGKRKLRQYPPGFGAGALNESAEIPRTTEITDRLLAAADFVGLASVEAKRHEETGEMVLIEANVFVPRYFGLGDAAGVEASWRLYATLAGLPLGPQPRQQRVRNLVLTLEPRAAWAYLADGGSVRSLIASYKGVRDVGGMSLRDPLPLWIVLWRQLKLGLRYVARRLADIARDVMLRPSRRHGKVRAS